MDYVKELAELKSKICSTSLETDIRNIDQYQREIKYELTLKRNQVTQLKRELDRANFKNFELNKQLENTNSTLKETDFNLKLALKKSSLLEEKMKEMEESYMRMKLKEEMRMTEINILNENLQKMAHDKHQLNSEVQELNDKLKFYCVFQNELDNKQIKINEMLVKFKEDKEQLEKEHLSMTELEKQLKCSEEFRNLSHNLAEENKRLKTEIIDLENSVVKCSALNEKLTELIQNHKHVNMYEQDLIMKIKFLQWENRCKDQEQRNISNETIIQVLTESLNKEIETSAKLILKNEDYEAQIEELQKNLLSHSKPHTSATIKSEVEIFEID